MKSISNYLDSQFDERFSIDLIGIKLNPDCYSRIRKRLKQLELRSPVKSSIKLRFGTVTLGIRGELVVRGYGKVFRSVVTGDDLFEIYELLEQNVDEKLLKWKRDRFLNPFGKQKGSYAS